MIGLIQVLDVVPFPSKHVEILVGIFYDAVPLLLLRSIDLGDGFSYSLNPAWICTVDRHHPTCWSTWQPFEPFVGPGMLT